MKTIRNNKTGQAGLVIKENPKTYGVSLLHKEIHHAHYHANWKKENCTVKEHNLDGLK